MPNIGMVELLVIAMVALIVIGPKDLPKVFHNLGKMTAKLRSMSREFTRAMEDAAKESGVDTMAKDLKGLSNPSKYGLDTLKDAAKDTLAGRGRVLRHGRYGEGCSTQRRGDGLETHENISLSQARRAPIGPSRLMPGGTFLST